MKEAYVGKSMGRAKSRQPTYEVYTCCWNRKKQALEHGCWEFDARPEVGNPLFAIPRALQREHMEGITSAEQMLDRYFQHLQDSYRRHPQKWEAVFAPQVMPWRVRPELVRIAIICNAKHDDIMAHRMLLRNFIIDLLTEMGHDVRHGGELNPPKSPIKHYQ